LWFEILKTLRTSSQWIKYQYPKAILSRLQCFMSYSCIFGLTGSLGQKAERQFLSEHCKAVTFNVPYFLDTCRAEGGKVQGKNVPRHICETSPLPNERAQELAVLDLAAAKCAEVPVLIITKDHENVERYAEQLEKKLAQLYGSGGEKTGGKSGKKDGEDDNVIRLLQNPRKPDEFCQLVNRATEPVKATGEETAGKAQQAWRITITTAEGGRGHDYRVVDPKIDEKGGLLLILTWVPWSEREWVQFLGRTSRQDHVGQYAVFLDGEDDRVQDGTQDQRSDENLIQTMLRIGDEDAVDTFERTAEEVQKGRVMHRLTSRFWILEKQGNLTKDQIWQWKRLCEQYMDFECDEIQEKFDEVFPPPKKSQEEIFDVDDDSPKAANKAGRSAARTGGTGGPAEDGGFGPKPEGEPMIKPGPPRPHSHASPGAGSSGPGRPAAGPGTSQGKPPHPTAARFTPAPRSG
jgi:hypothetical protein